METNRKDLVKAVQDLIDDKKELELRVKHHSNEAQVYFERYHACMGWFFACIMILIASLLINLYFFLP